MGQELFAHGMLDPQSDEAWCVASLQGLKVEADIEQLGAKAIEVFTTGECHGLAAALSCLLGAPCVIAAHPRYHVGVRLGGWMLDIEGLTPVAEWERRWAKVEPTTGETERSWRLLTFDDAGAMLDACLCGTPDLDTAGVYAQLVCEQLGIEIPAQGQAAA